MVVGLNPVRRQVLVGSPTGGRTSVRLREVNWLTQRPETDLPCTVKLRARDAPHPATVRAAGEGARVNLANPALAAPGQACVFYAGDRVLGGGFIQAPDQPATVDGASRAALSPALPGPMAA